MKRKITAASAEGANTRRRQAQISCDFCRLKKLKCDRAQPCSNCAARGLECHGQIIPALDTNRASTDGSPHNDEILERLRRLETAVFGASGTSEEPTRTGIHVAGHQSRPRPNAAGDGDPLDPPQRRRYKRCPLSCFDNSDNVDRPTLDHSDKFQFLILPSYHHDAAHGTPHSSKPDAVTFTTTSSDTDTKCVWLPSKEVALALLQARFDDCVHMDHIISDSGARALVEDVYSHLMHHEPLGHIDHIALMLAICAESAFYCPGTDANAAAGGSPPTTTFDSARKAAHQSFIWRKTAWELVGQSERANLSSLPGIQARMILVQLVYNMEGASPRMRYLLSAALTAARNLYLHLTDCSGFETKDDAVTREMKRRVWWHLVSTDWLLSCMGGPSDRIYTVNPRHMRVRYPRNINDVDLPRITGDDDGGGSDGTTASRPPATDVMTDMSYFLTRVRLAEACREIADTLALGSGDVDELRYDQVLGLDHLFDEVLDSFPSCFNLDWYPDPPAVLPPQIVKQRQIMHLATQARRARLFRCFIQPGIADTDLRFRRFRSTCFESAQTVLEIGSHFLQGSIVVGRSTRPPLAGQQHEERDRGGQGRKRQKQAREQAQQQQQYLPMARHSEIAIYHLFQACVVLASDPDLRAANGTNKNPNPVAEARREALTNTCRLLEKVSRQFPVAADLVNRLVAVLRRYRVHGVEPDRPKGGDGGGDHSPYPQTNEPDPRSSAIPGGVRPNKPAYRQEATAALVEETGQNPHAVTMPTAIRNNTNNGDISNDFTAVIAQQQQQQEEMEDSSGITSAPWAFDPAVMDFNNNSGGGGIWDDLMGTVPLSDAWGQLFADLDVVGGPVV